MSQSQVAAGRTVLAQFECRSLRYGQVSLSGGNTSANFENPAGYLEVDVDDHRNHSSL
jgi:hypothetical protein